MKQPTREKYLDAVRYIMGPRRVHLRALVKDRHLDPGFMSLIISQNLVQKTEIRGYYTATEVGRHVSPDFIVDEYFRQRDTRLRGKWSDLPTDGMINELNRRGYFVTNQNQ